MTTSRVQAGVPTCGQFTPSAHAEAGIALDARPGLEQTGQDRPENADVGADPKDTDEWEDQGLEQSEAARIHRGRHRGGRGGGVAVRGVQCRGGSGVGQPGFRLHRRGSVPA